MCIRDSREVFQGGIEFGTPYLILDKLKEAIKNTDKEAINKNIETLKKVYADVHNKDCLLYTSHQS